MKLMDKITSKFACKASDAVKETVKKEAKNIASDILPVMTGAVALIGGVLIFKRMANYNQVTKTAEKIVPTISHTVTNNYILGDTNAAKEIVDKILKSVE